MPLKVDRRLLVYPGEYVALHDGRVVGHDPDDEVLATRMFAQLGEEAFYIVHAEDMAVHMPWPELAR